MVTFSCGIIDTFGSDPYHSLETGGTGMAACSEPESFFQIALSSLGSVVATAVVHMLLSVLGVVHLSTLGIASPVPKDSATGIVHVDSSSTGAVHVFVAGVEGEVQPLV